MQESVQRKQDIMQTFLKVIIILKQLRENDYENYK